MAHTATASAGSEQHVGDTAVQTGPDDEPARATAAADPGGARRQTHLSQPEVELVIARAVELQQDRDAGRGAGLTLAQLQDVVAQVGVDADLVRRALDEVRLATVDGATTGWVDRVLGPRRVAGAAVVTGSPDEVSRAIARWMVDDEGLLLAGNRDGADRWVPDKRVLTQVRHGLGATRSESALRGLRGVTARTEPASDGTLVAIEADTSSIRTTNAAVLSVGGLVGIGAGIAAAAGLPDGAGLASDVVQFAVGLGVPVAASAGVATAVHRTWLGRVRRAVVQAVDGISMTSRHGDAPPAAPSHDWRALRRQWFGGS